MNNVLYLACRIYVITCYIILVALILPLMFCLLWLIVRFVCTCFILFQSIFLRSNIDGWTLSYSSRKKRGHAANESLRGFCFGRWHGKPDCSTRRKTITIAWKVHGKFIPLIINEKSDNIWRKCSPHQPPTGRCWWLVGVVGCVGEVWGVPNTVWGCPIVRGI